MTDGSKMLERSVISTDLNKADAQQIKVDLEAGRDSHSAEVESTAHIRKARSFNPHNSLPKKGGLKDRFGV